MPARVPSADELRASAAAIGIKLTDDDLERLLGFLRVLLPQIEELQHVVPRDGAPAALYRPELEA
jgi:hypothetical protein